MSQIELEFTFGRLGCQADEIEAGFKPLPANISPEDLEFLRFRGALSIPESGLWEERWSE